jgi:hypothetical protein
MDASFWFVVGGVYGFHGFKSKHKNRVIVPRTQIQLFLVFILDYFKIVLIDSNLPRKVNRRLGGCEFFLTEENWAGLESLPMQPRNLANNQSS